MTGLLLLALCVQADAGPYQATGFRIFEVDQTHAVVWTRLTRNPKRVPKTAPQPRITARRGQPPTVEFPDGATIDAIEGACPGAAGQTRVRYRERGAGKWTETPWGDVDPERDFTRTFTLKDLKPGTRYEVRVEAKGGAALDGGFRTAPPVDAPAKVVFTVSTGQRYTDQDAKEGGFRIYDAILELDPDFFVHTGDILYYDQQAKTEALARWHWHRTYSLPTNLRFHRQVATYFIKDDHDTWMNDCWPTMESRNMGTFTFKQGQAIFLEQSGLDTPTYRTIRWGKDLQIWMVEGRDYRSPNRMPDGPEKTIWGAEQKAWFKRTVKASDATFRILISPTPIVGPDRGNKHDNHANDAFTHEGDELRAFIKSQKDMVVVCGDRHWQYVSVHPETGVREYCCGPASNEHAGGWSNKKRMPEHRYLNVIGGFLSATVERVDGKPRLAFRHHGVNGKILNEEILNATR